MACEVLESALVCMSQQVCATYRDIWASVYYLICSCTFRSTRSKCMRRSCRMIDHTIVDCMVISGSRCVLTYHCIAYYAKRCADLSCTTKRLKEKKAHVLVCPMPTTTDWVFSICSEVCKLLHNSGPEHPGRVLCLLHCLSFPLVLSREPFATC